jgi:hypothetical protein
MVRYWAVNSDALLDDPKAGQLAEMMVAKMVERWE